LPQLFIVEIEQRATVLMLQVPERWSYRLGGGR
jgi:hypothetical protein